jgi:hypothetical protein
MFGQQICDDSRLFDAGEETPRCYVAQDAARTVRSRQSRRMFTQNCPGIDAALGGDPVQQLRRFLPAPPGDFGERHLSNPADTLDDRARRTSRRSRSDE